MELSLSATGKGRQEWFFFFEWLILKEDWSVGEGSGKGFREEGIFENLKKV